MRLLVCLVGVNIHDRASIFLTAHGEQMHIVAAASVAELTPQAVAGVDVFLAWDEGKTIAQLKAHLSILAHRAPIIAIARSPTVKQVVAALVAGAVDFLEWPCSAQAITESVISAVQAAARALPLEQRAIEARRYLRKLSKRERQVLTAMAQGMSNKTIAEILEIDPRTVELHRRSLLDKLEVEHSAEAIRLELEASVSPEWNRQADWMAPWMVDGSLPRAG